MPRGRIELITGPMFSGKTDALIERLRVLEAEGLTVLAVKPSLDVRPPTGTLESHSGKQYPASQISASDDFETLANQADVVGIDEAQFLDEALVSAVHRLKAAGRLVVIAGLDLDYLRDPFRVVAALATLADHVETRVAQCAVCGRPAEFTQRLRDGRPAARSEPRIEVGGADLYEPRCQNCYQAPA